MRIVALVCNIVLFASICLVVLTEGVPGEARYLIFTLLALVVPILSSVVLLRERRALQAQRMRDEQSSASTFISRVAVVSNLVLLGFTCWAAASQYPYAEGNGVIPFGVLMVFTPIISLVVLLGSRKGKMQGQAGTIADQE